MSIEIMQCDRTSRKVMFCNTTDWAFGPVFPEDHDPEDFINYVEAIGLRDPRTITPDNELERVYNDWLRFKEAVDAKLKAWGFVHDYDYEIDRNSVRVQYVNKVAGVQILFERNRSLVHDIGCDLRTFLIEVEEIETLDGDEISVEEAVQLLTAVNQE